MTQHDPSDKTVAPSVTRPRPDDADPARPDEPAAKPDDQDGNPLLREGANALDAADIEDPDRQL
jgi:hypothetical protein